MTDDINTGDGLVGQKLPRDLEMIVTAFLPNLKHLESRFDRIDLDIKELGIGVKDSNNRLSALEKRFDYFEVQVDKRFDLLTSELRDFKNDANRRFEQVEKRFEQVDKRFENVDRRFDQIAASIERLGDKLDARDSRQRSFTLRMFGIAITISFLGILGVLVKTFGVL